MALHLYRRHRRDCAAAHPCETRSGEFEERQKGWKRCGCFLYVSGTLGGHFNRRTTHKTAWEDARAYVAALEHAQSWNPPEEGAPAPSLPSALLANVSPGGADLVAAHPCDPPRPMNPARITIAKAIEAFLATKGATVGYPTYRKHKTFTTQLRVFADGEGYVMLDQFRPEDIDIFYARSTLGPRSKAKMLERLRSFFQYAVNRSWLPKSPVSRDLKPPKGATCPPNKVPFTDEQLEDIIKACDQVEFKDRWGNRFGTGSRTGEDLKDFIWVLTYTGLRISDVVLFDINRLDGNDVFLRAKKNGGDVFTLVPEWLTERLHARAKRFGTKPFLTGKAKSLDTTIDLWRRHLAKVFALADVGDEPATPHRFRHTFARILLQKGVPIPDVADLLGDDEATVRKHYARWVPERQARLTRILQEAFTDKPRLALIQGGRAS